MNTVVWSLMTLCVPVLALTLLPVLQAPLHTAAMEEEENSPPPTREDPTGGNEEQGHPASAPSDRELSQPGPLCPGQVIMVRSLLPVGCWELNWGGSPD